MKNKGLICLLLLVVPILQAHSQDTLFTVLKGKVGRKDYHTYISKPFVLPAGVRRLRVEFSYTGKEQRTTIDLGVWDAERFRGWSISGAPPG